MIYFDNSATTCVDRAAADRAVEIMRMQFGNPSSLHGAGAAAYRELGIARNQIAKMLAARTSGIFFTSGGTESNNLAVLGTAMASVPEEKHIVTTAIEHDSILRSCAHLEKNGWDVTYVQPDPETRRILAKDVIAAVRDDTALVSVMFVNNETGEILPLREIIKGVRNRNPRTRIHCDCVQGFGKLPFKLHVYDVDMVSASSHKIHGPKGVGALYLRRPDMICPMEYGGNQEGGINPGTENTPAACAFGLAADQALYAMERNEDAVRKVRTYLLDRLREEFPQIHVNSPENGFPFVLNFSLPGHASHEMVSFLSLHEIYLSVCRLRVHQRGREPCAESHAV